MQKDAKIYIEQTILPPIAKEYPKMASEMSIQVRGSYALGVTDQFSDLEAIIWLDDPLWKTHGGQVQLMLQRWEQQHGRFAPAGYGHSEIYVWSFSRLGCLREFLEMKADLPWEKVGIEEFYELQESLIIRDPHNVFHRLREATAPERTPDWLWKKLLISKLNKLEDDIQDFKTEVARSKMIESHIILGSLLEDLLLIGFITNRKYYPYRKHLQWAFARLPALASEVLPHIQAIASSADWTEKLASIEATKDTYSDYIMERSILTLGIMADLIWAERFEAWSNPHWRDRLNRGEQKTKEAGYDSSYGWIWHWWDWI